MDHTVTFFLPFPPSANTLWRCVNGRFIRSSKYKKWQLSAVMRITEQRIKFPVFGAYELNLQLPKGINRGDADNRMKAVNDILQIARMIVDDKFCRRAAVEWSEIVGHDCLVTVTGDVAYKDQWEYAKAMATRAIANRVKTTKRVGLKAV